MMTLKDYPVNLGFGATTPPYSKANPHHGIDIAAPLATPIEVNGVVIGYVGTTGASTGYHCHIDKNKNLWSATGYVDPKDWNTITGVVVATGDFGTAGLAVVIQADNGYFYRFLHMSSIKAKEGDTVTMLDDEGKKNVYRLGLFREPENDQVWRGLPSNFNDAAFTVRGSKEWMTNNHILKVAYPQLVKENKQLKAQLGNASEANILGQALIKLLTSLGYKKS